MKTAKFIEDEIHSEDLQEIIAKPPSWLLKRGISIILGVLLLIITLSAYIHFPEMITSQIKFNNINSPKAIVTRVNGNLVKLLVKEGSWVNRGDELAYLESTGDHVQTIKLLKSLQGLKMGEISNRNLKVLLDPKNLNLGELQISYQNFYLSYLNFSAASKDGIYLKRKIVLENEKENLYRQYNKASQSAELQEKQLAIAEAEFDKYKLLAEKKVISPSELQDKEALLLSKKQSIPQMENNLINYEGHILSKNKEIIEIDNQISEEQKKFVQALNSFISEAEIWRQKYILTSPVQGKVIYGSFLQENQLVKANQELFYINPGNEQYYGELRLPQSHFAKVKKGQQVLIKVRSFPYHEYGYLHGEIDNISEIPMQDSIFYSRVQIIRSQKDSLIILKPGIYGDAEIITEDKSIFKRIWENLTKSLKI